MVWPNAAHDALRLNIDLLGDRAFLAVSRRQFSVEHTIAIVSETHPAVSLKPSHQDKDQEHNEYEPKPSATIVARTVEAPAADPAESSEKCDYDYDEQNSSNRHGVPFL
jgi:hypothetical protein